jgi:hypothetical protein
VEVHFLEDIAPRPVLTSRKSGSLTVQVIADATAADGWDGAAPRKEWLDDDDDMGQIIREVKAVDRPMWKDISVYNPT